MKVKTLIILVVVCVFYSGNLHAQRTSYIGSGSWNISTNWDNGLPNATKSAEIPLTSVVNVQSSVSCFDLLIASGTLSIDSMGILDVHGRFLNDGNFTIMSGGRFILRSGVFNIFGRRNIEIASSIELSTTVEVDQTFNFGN